MLETIVKIREGVFRQWGVRGVGVSKTWLITCHNLYNFQFLLSTAIYVVNVCGIYNTQNILDGISAKLCW